MNDEFEIVLEDRIRRLRGPDPQGDWLDVRRRARRSGRRAVALAAAVVLLVAVPTVAVGSRLLDVLGVTSSDQTVPTTSNAAPVPHIHGDLLFIPGGSPLRLAMPVLAPLLGQEEPLAVPTAGWTDLVYHAWEGTVGGDESGGTPLLRRVDLRSGTDTVYARGAQSVAIDVAGSVAFMDASSERYESSPEGTLGGRFGHVMVAPGLDEPAEQWTTARGEYVVIGWAREMLLIEARPGPAYLLPEGEAGPPPGVYALSGRGDLRPLPLRGVVAISPDGRRALGWWSSSDSPPTGSRLVDIASGRIIATSPVTLTRRGAWHGSRVVVSVGGNRQQLAVFDLKSDLIRLERRLPLAVDRALRATYGPFLGSPVFTADGDTVILRVASLTTNERPQFVGFLTCQLEARACIRGRNLLPPTKWGAIVHNPSRPAAVRVRCDPIAFVPNSDDIASTIVAVRVNCAEARNFIRFIRRTHSFMNGRRRFRARGYTCSVSVDATTLPVARYSCRSGQRTVNWEKR